MKERLYLKELCEKNLPGVGGRFFTEDPAGYV
jgi:hypothetical protein